MVDKLKIHARLIGEIVTVTVIVIFAMVSLLPTASLFGTPKINDGDLTYHGQIKNHKYDGKGKLTFQNADYYVGDFKDGRFANQGKFVSHDGWEFQGKFRHGVPNGKGQIKQQNQIIFQGDFKNGEVNHAN